jgi:hypothetical protein
VHEQFQYHDFLSVEVVLTHEQDVLVFPLAHADVDVFPDVVFEDENALLDTQHAYDVPEAEHDEPVKLRFL